MPIVIPALMSFYIGLVKDTSIAYIVGLHELLRSSQLIAQREIRPMEIYLAAAAIYFVLCFPLSRIAVRLEARLRRSGIAQERLAV
jgi:polar amino acid transport system permease protein